MLYSNPNTTPYGYVAVRLSLQQYCIDSLEMYSQPSLFGRSFSALFISNSRQCSLAGTQQNNSAQMVIPIYASCSSEYTGSIFYFSTGSTRSMRRVPTAQIQPVSLVNPQQLQRIIPAKNYCEYSQYTV